MAFGVRTLLPNAASRPPPPLTDVLVENISPESQVSPSYDPRTQRFAPCREAKSLPRIQRKKRISSPSRSRKTVQQRVVVAAAPTHYADGPLKDASNAASPVQIRRPRGPPGPIARAPRFGSPPSGSQQTIADVRSSRRLPRKSDTDGPRPATLTVRPSPSQDASEEPSIIQIRRNWRELGRFKGAQSFRASSDRKTNFSNCLSGTFSVYRR